MMLLAVVSSSAWAEWVELGGNDTATTYVDAATIRKVGDMVKMWSLFDLKPPRDAGQNKPYMSMMTQDEYDCKEERSRALSMNFYSGSMGRGGLIHTDSDPGKWSPIVPGSAQTHLWEFACGKR